MGLMEILMLLALAALAYLAIVFVNLMTWLLVKAIGPERLDIPREVIPPLSAIWRLDGGV